MRPISKKVTKKNKTIDLLRKFQQVISSSFLITIYQAFIKHLLAYCDAVFDQAFNHSFQQRQGSIRYNAALAITGAIRGTSKRMFYPELGLESIQSRREFQKLYLSYKIIKAHRLHILPGL